MLQSIHSITVLAVMPYLVRVFMISASVTLHLVSAVMQAGTCIAAMSCLTLPHTAAHAPAPHPPPNNAYNALMHVSALWVKLL